MTLSESLKIYLQNQIIAGDESLKSKYKEERLSNCVKYVTEMARKALNGKSGALSQDVVYSWARHYFNDIMEKEILKEALEEEKRKLREEERKNNPEKFIPSSSSKTERKEESKPKFEQLSLFDF